MFYGTFKGRFSLLLILPLLLRAIARHNRTARPEDPGLTKNLSFTRPDKDITMPQLADKAALAGLVTACPLRRFTAAAHPACFFAAGCGQTAFATVSDGNTSVACVVRPIVRPCPRTMARRSRASSCKGPLAFHPVLGRHDVYITLYSRSFLSTPA